MSEQNKALIRQWYREVWEGNAATISTLFVGQAYGFPDPASSIDPTTSRPCRRGRLAHPQPRSLSRGI